MRKDITITLEEECVNCPKLSLETITHYADNETYKIHQCEHLGFCKAVRINWEEVRKGNTSSIRHGKWIPVTNGRGGFECDNCHNYAPSYRDGVEWLSDFCANCGAKMKRKGEEE